AGAIARRAEASNLDIAVIERSFGVKLGLPKMIGKFLFTYPLLIGLRDFLAHLFVNAVLISLARKRFAVCIRGYRPPHHFILRRGHFFPWRCFTSSAMSCASTHWIPGGGESGISRAQPVPPPGTPPVPRTLLTCWLDGIAPCELGPVGARAR